MNTINYDPAQYWNSREHPNTAVDPPVGPVEWQFFGPKLAGATSVLEIGPGVGRLFPLYKGIPRVATLDLSRNYGDRAERAARAAGIAAESHYIDNALERFPFRDSEFDAGVTSHVLMHIPFENILHSMSEAARCCKKVIVLSVVHRAWPKKGMRYDPKWHCFNHDYEAICNEAGLSYREFEKFNESADVGSFGFVFGRAV